MKNRRVLIRTLAGLVAGGLLAACGSNDASDAAARNDALEWAETRVEKVAVPTDRYTDFAFVATNRSSGAIQINGIVTPNDLEALPHDDTIAPGAEWPLTIRFHHFKPGIDDKSFFVKTSSGTSRLEISLETPPGNLGIEFSETTLVKQTEPGDLDASFTFSMKNTTEEPVKVISIETSCGCTTSKLPEDPWILQPQVEGSFDVVMNLIGRTGEVSKLAFFKTNLGLTQLRVTAQIPERNDSMASEEERARNLEIAAQNQRAIFEGDCRSCHVTPGEYLTGKPLYDAVCGVCHDSENRADLVPALAKPGERPAEYWRPWIENGKPNTLMPGFSQANGGPLSDEQIDSLVNALASDASQ